MVSLVAVLIRLGLGAASAFVDLVPVGTSISSELIAGTLVLGVFVLITYHAIKLTQAICLTVHASMLMLNSLMLRSRLVDVITLAAMLATWALSLLHRSIDLMIHHLLVDVVLDLFFSVRYVHLLDLLLQVLNELGLLLVRVVELRVLASALFDDLSVLLVVQIIHVGAVLAGVEIRVLRLQILDKLILLLL